MLFFYALLLASSIFSVTAAPIPMKRLVTRDVVGWPTNEGPPKQKEAFGITGGNFQEKFITTYNGEPVLKATYAANSYAGGDISGFTFQGSGPKDVDVKSGRVVEFSYKVFFPKKFKFVLAGKLPGLYGGENEEIATKCTGGHHNRECWSTRLMWRDEGKAVLYFYMPSDNYKLPFCEGKKCDNAWGVDFPLDVSFATGEWTTVKQVITLNTPGKPDGNIKVFVNDAQKLELDGVIFRISEDGRIHGVMWHTFFGGSSSKDYASPFEQWALFARGLLRVIEQLKKSAK